MCFVPFVLSTSGVCAISSLTVKGLLWNLSIIHADYTTGPSDLAYCQKWFLTTDAISFQDSGVENHVLARDMNNPAKYILPIVVYMMPSCCLKCFHLCSLVWLLVETNLILIQTLVETSVFDILLRLT